MTDDRYRAAEGQFQLTGVQAPARLPLDVRRADQRAGLCTAAFVSGYEGSPLGGYDLELGKQARSQHRRVDGVTGYWYGKSPGLDRASDALRHNNLMGTHRLDGALALVGDDPGAQSSTVPGSSELLLADLGMPTLYPADPQELLDLGQQAVALPRVCGLWVGFNIATNDADGTGTVRVGPRRFRSVAPDPVVGGKTFTHEMTARMLQPDLGRLESSRDGARLELARRYAAANGLNTILGGADARIGIAAAGKTYHDLRQALEILGLDEPELERRGVRLLRAAMVHPLDPEIVARFAAGLRENLTAGRRLRGTRLDPFGHTAIRRLERDLITEYELVIGELAERLPDLVRGYEDVKLGSVANYRTAVAQQMDEFRAVKAGAPC
ncbi:DUF6537 domain-containing protein [Amycolatopsis pithecellobii]|uniref:DUF6537 domain-containing protein n=1 Tax=Amycolatopsis pithecellobii TaxID=664692 RepID=UPI001AA076D4|nr:DUF6537 domain-containing protein [Amycolatopsis pithecellobii]